MAEKNDVEAREASTDELSDRLRTSIPCRFGVRCAAVGNCGWKVTDSYRQIKWPSTQMFLIGVECITNSKALSDSILSDLPSAL